MKRKLEDVWDTSPWLRKLALLLAPWVILGVYYLIGAPQLVGSARATSEYDSGVTYWPAGKLKLGKRVAYRFVCANACQVTAQATLMLPGPNLGPYIDTTQLVAGQVGYQYLFLHKSNRVAIATHLGRAKLRTRISAIDIADGATDTEAHTFGFRR